MGGSQFGTGSGTPSAGEPSGDAFGYFGNGSPGPRVTPPAAGGFSAPQSGLGSFGPPTGFGTFGQIVAPSPGLPTARRRRVSTGVVVVAVVGSLAVLGGGKYLLDRLTHPMRDVALPASAAGHTRLTTPQVQQIEQQLQGRLDPTTFIAPAVGVYGDAGAVRTMVVVARHSRTSDLSNAQAELQAGFTSGLPASATATALVSSDPGPLGGTLQCTVLQVAGRGGGALCFWVDAGTFGMVFDLTSTDVSAAADVTRQVRTASEH